MSEPLDPLEAELSALRPHEVSPGLRRRVAERLSEIPRAKPRWLWRIAFAGGLAAAFLTAILLWWRAGRRVEPELVERSQPAHVEEVEFRPTLLAYQRALARSPEDLDALLDKDALTGTQPNPEPMRIRAFGWSHELGEN